MDLTQIRGCLEPIGHRVLKTLTANRPDAASLLYSQNLLLNEISAVQSHFQARMTALSEQYEQYHPTPSGIPERVHHLALRESYVNAGLDREIANWVANIPRHLTATPALSPE